MNWKSLLSTRRVGQQSEEQAEVRNAYQRDFDRIVFSPAFRRLQSKTQVFPLPETDFVHTRLTHSLESSCVGRSLGQMAGELLLGRGQLKGVEPWHLSSVVAAANLAHDIGNPPFGHGGEEAISDFFSSPTGREITKQFTPAQRKDLECFEGNAMGFRLLTSTNPKKSSRTGGLGITEATIGAFTKYPCDSLAMDKRSGQISRKKYGYFQTERDQFTEIAAHLQLPRGTTGGHTSWARHPLSFLVEASDDICYLAMDLEDGYRLGIVPFSEAEELYLNVVSHHIAMTRYRQILTQEERIGYLRAIAINTLVSQVAHLFADNIDPILKGTWNTALTDNIPGCDSLSDIRSLSIAKIYSYRKVQEIEAAGFEIISGLLDHFISALSNPHNKRSQKTLHLVSPSYIFHMDDPQSAYEAVMYILQFVAGMTDRFAVDTYRTLKGISLPVY